jgi:hypothetical protein
MASASAERLSSSSPDSTASARMPTAVPAVPNMIILAMLPAAPPLGHSLHSEKLQLIVSFGSGRRHRRGRILEGSLLPKSQTRHIVPTSNSEVISD